MPSLLESEMHTPYHCSKNAEPKVIHEASFPAIDEEVLQETVQLECFANKVGILL